MNDYRAVGAETTDDEIADEALDRVIAARGAVPSPEEAAMIALAVEAAIHQATARTAKRMQVMEAAKFWLMGEPSTKYPLTAIPEEGR